MIFSAYGLFKTVPETHSNASNGQFRWKSASHPWIQIAQSQLSIWVPCNHMNLMRQSERTAVQGWRAQRRWGERELQVTRHHVALSLYTEMVSHEPSDVTASGILAKSVRKWRMPSQLHMLYTCSAHGWVCPTTWIELELMILWSPKTKPQPSRHLDHGLGKVVEMKSLRQRPGLQNAC